MRTVTVTGVADNLSDGDQDYAIVLTGDSSSTDLRFRNVDPEDVSVRNLDYTAKGGFYVSQISGDTDENLNTAFFTVSLSSAPSSDNVTITMATSDAGEGSISGISSASPDNTSQLVFTASNWNSVRTVTVTGVADNLSDGDQDYAIVLTGDSSSTDLRFRNVDPEDVSVRNLDYTAKGGFYVSQISGDTDENLNTAFFTVSLSSAPSSDNVTITMATSDAGEGSISGISSASPDNTSQLVFTASNWNSVRTVTVTGVADNLSDGDQDYAIVLTGDSSSTDLRFRNVDPEDVSVRNLDYTAKGGFYVSQISGDTDENLNTAFFTVSLSSAPSSDNVTITMATSDAGEGSISGISSASPDNTSQLVFTASNWNSVRTVTVTGVADNLSDGDQDYAIVLTGDSSSTDLRFRNVDPEDVSVRNLDYTAKGGFYVSQISGDTDENLNTAFFTVSLSSAPSSDNVTITMATSDAGEGSISGISSASPDNTSQLVFTASNWNSVRTVTVTGVADNLSDGDQDYAIVLTGDSSSTDLRFRNVDPEDVSVRNLDYTAKGGFYVSQISGDTDENLNTAFFTVSLSSAPSSDNVTITMATSDAGEGSISGISSASPDNTSQLVFTASNWNSVRTVTVTGVADNLSDGDQDYAIVLTGDSSSTDLRFRNVDPEDVSVRNLDYTAKGGFYVSQISGDTDENLNTAFFTVSLSSAPSSDNVTITMATSDAGKAPSPASAVRPRTTPRSWSLPPRTGTR